MTRVWFLTLCSVLMLGPACGEDGRDPIDAEPVPDDAGPRGACTVRDAGEAGLVIACPDGTSAQVPGSSDGVDGANGENGTSCSVVDHGDGTKTIACTDGTSVTVRDGENGENGENGVDGTSCSVVDHGDGTKTIACTDGTSVTVRDGENGENGVDGTSCSVVDHGDGTKTIACTDGTSVTVRDGVDGTNGENGENGVDGTSCSVVDHGDGTKTIACTDGTSVTVRDGVAGTGCSVRYVGRGVGEMACGDGSSVRLWTGFPPAVVAGNSHTCALKRDGHVSCWGSNLLGESDAPSDLRFEQIVAARHTTCGITEARELLCWGEDAAHAPHDGGPWVDVALDSYVGSGCALSGSGQVRCWGAYEGFDRDVGAGATQLSLGGHDMQVACAVNASQRPFCWYWSYTGSRWAVIDESAFRAGRVIDIAYPYALYDDHRVASVHNNFHGFHGIEARRFVDSTNCLLTQDRRVLCPNQRTTPGGEIEDAAFGTDHVCALRADDSVACSANYEWQAELRAAVPSEAGFVDITVGNRSACAIRADGSASCFLGDAAEGTPSSSFAKIEAGAGGACGLSDDGHIACWGPLDGLGGVGDFMVNTMFTAMSVHDGYVCGAAENGRVHCAGRDVLTGELGGPSLWPPQGRKYVDVSVGGNRMFCVIDDQQTPSCFDAHGRSRTIAPLSGPVDALWGAYESACALPRGGELTCGGYEDWWSPMPADTQFTQLDVGRYELCGVRADGSFACWGQDRSGIQHAPLETSLKAIGVGDDFACGLDTAGAVLCWGAGDHGQAEVPAELR